MKHLVFFCGGWCFDGVLKSHLFSLLLLSPMIGICLHIVFFLDILYVIWIYPRHSVTSVTVTTRMTLQFLVGNPYKPSFVTVTGWGVRPNVESSDVLPSPLIFTSVCLRITILLVEGRILSSFSGPWTSKYFLMFGVGYFVGAPVIPNLRRVVFGCLGRMKMLPDFLCWPGCTPAISN